MRDPHAWALLTYTSDDGKTTKQVWNPREGAAVPQQIDLGNGRQGSLTSVQPKGRGYSPPQGTATLSDKPPEPDRPGTRLGWPGQAYIQ